MYYPDLYRKKFAYPGLEIIEYRNCRNCRPQGLEKERMSQVSIRKHLDQRVTQNKSAPHSS